MSLGGNKNLKEFFRTYDLNEESVQTKYKSKASAYYRSKVCQKFIYIHPTNSYDAWLREYLSKNLRSLLMTRAVNLLWSKYKRLQAR